MKNIKIAVDEHVHRKWRMQAAREGVTLKEFIIQAVSRAVAPDISNAALSRKKGGEK